MGMWAGRQVEAPLYESGMEGGVGRQTEYLARLGALPRLMQSASAGAATPAT